jgi:RNA polymerase sigma-70 factor (ECF subfamily)
MTMPEVQWTTPEALEQRLSLIPTLWSLVYRAHQEPGEAAQGARQQLLDRYGGAARRYLRKVLGDADAADDVAQEFALQIVHGKLGGADPDRGRFRNFVKGTLLHLIADYRKAKRRWPGPLPADSTSIAASPEDPAAELAFVESWRDELLARAWSALAQGESETGQPYYTVLRFRADHPDIRSPQMADALAAALGRPMTPVAVRQLLHRARERFAILLVDEVTHSLAQPSVAQLQEELIELGLFEYCRSAFSPRDGNAAG